MISDKELREAARQYEQALLRALPEPEDCEAAFSPDFERKMKKLIFRVDHPIRYWLRRLLPVLLAVGLAAAALLLAKQAPAEEPPVQTQTEPPAASAEPSPPGESQEPAARAIVYRPTWLPEGCEWDRETLYENEGMIVYRTPGGGEAVFLYDLTGGGPENPGGGREVPVGDGIGTLLLGRNKEALNELFWADEGAGVSFWLSAPFGEEDMVHVAESVRAEA